MYDIYFTFSEWFTIYQFIFSRELAQIWKYVSREHCPLHPEEALCFYSRNFSGILRGSLFFGALKKKKKKVKKKKK